MNKDEKTFKEEESHEILKIQVKNLDWEISMKEEIIYLKK